MAQRSECRLSVVPWTVTSGIVQSEFSINSQVAKLSICLANSQEKFLPKILFILKTASGSVR